MGESKQGFITFFMRKPVFSPPSRVIGKGDTPPSIQRSNVYIPLRFLEREKKTCCDLRRCCGVLVHLLTRSYKRIPSSRTQRRGSKKEKKGRENKKKTHAAAGEDNEMKDERKCESRKHASRNDEARSIEENNQFRTGRLNR
mmetsp:Transcript_12566/g.20148  ORF Transcript_12566/g.20148 Transcript_12566/m.20148 type:complete len:142 (+) Transcript_12566:1616-2041(+)